MKQFLIEKQLNLLDYFSSVCKENNLRYSLAYGTLLGCIRGEGYIPWDHDIDVMMPRKDYEYFLKIFDQNNNNDFFLQTYNSEKKYPYLFAKLRDSNTTFIEGNLHIKNLNHGIFIDIFPYDILPKNLIKRNYQLLLNQLILKITCSRVDTSAKLFLIKKIINWLFDHKFILNQLEKMRIKNENEGGFADLCYGITSKYTYLVFDSLFCKFIEEKFEKKSYKITSVFEQYLTSEYGDYLTPVSEDQINEETKGLKRNIISTHKSYREVIRESRIFDD